MQTDYGIKQQAPKFAHADSTHNNFSDNDKHQTRTNYGSETASLHRIWRVPSPNRSPRAPATQKSWLMNSQTQTQTPSTKSHNMNTAHNYSPNTAQNTNTHVHRYLHERTRDGRAGRLDWGLCTLRGVCGARKGAPAHDT